MSCKILHTKIVITFLLLSFVGCRESGLESDIWGNVLSPNVTGVVQGQDEWFDSISDFYTALSGDSRGSALEHYNLSENPYTEIKYVKDYRVFYTIGSIFKVSKNQSIVVVFRTAYTDAPSVMPVAAQVFYDKWESTSDGFKITTNIRVKIQEFSDYTNL